MAVNARSMKKRAARAASKNLTARQKAEARWGTGATPRATTRMSREVAATEMAGRSATERWIELVTAAFARVAGKDGVARLGDITEEIYARDRKVKVWADLVAKYPQNEGQFKGGLMSKVHSIIKSSGMFRKVDNGLYQKATGRQRRATVKVINIRTPEQAEADIARWALRKIASIRKAA